MVRGDEESFMEYGFGVAGLNGYGKYAISSDGTACYSGDVQGSVLIFTDGILSEIRQEPETS